ncbi:uncharacterized protein LOC135478188 [Liolophura sinensis]|uniref:uncharacterized protein LOC135478188 n=1 Tax=Liolophura sinensis TaxID=3198878 RepID=UPI0031589D72
MPPKKKQMTSAEKQRAYRNRINADPEKREAAKEKERLRWKARREKKKVKYVADMTKREVRATRRKWRIAYHKRRAEKDHLAWLEKQEAAVLTGTPPTSPPHNLPQQEPQRQPEPQPGTSANPTSSQKKRGRKNVRRDRTACYRINRKLTEKLENEKRKNQKLRKQLSRTKLKIKVPFGQNCKEGDVCATHYASPRKRARQTINAGQGFIRKELIFHYALTQQIKQGKDTCEKNPKRAQLFAKLFGFGNILSKYRLLTKAQNTGLLSKKLLKTNAKQRNENLLVYERAKKRNCVTDAVKQKIQKFFERDDVSWCAAGKKQVITRNKVKKQKRFLLESLRSTYRKYVHLHPVRPVSFSQFWKLKPFWVVKPKFADRETCLCKVHENVHLLHNKLKNLGYLAEGSADETINQIVCSRDNKGCMYRDCAKCKHAEVVFNQTKYRPG